MDGSRPTDRRPARPAPASGRLRSSARSRGGGRRLQVPVDAQTRYPEERGARRRWPARRAADPALVGVEGQDGADAGHSAGPPTPREPRRPARRPAAARPGRSAARPAPRRSGGRSHRPRSASRRRTGSSRPSRRRRAIARLKRFRSRYWILLHGLGEMLSVVEADRIDEPPWDFRESGSRGPSSAWRCSPTPRGTRRSGSSSAESTATVILDSRRACCRTSGQLERSRSTPRRGRSRGPGASTAPATAPTGARMVAHPGQHRVPPRVAEKDVVR